MTEAACLLHKEAAWAEAAQGKVVALGDSLREVGGTSCCVTAGNRQFGVACLGEGMGVLDRSYSEAQL